MDARNEAYQHPAPLGGRIPRDTSALRANMNQMQSLTMELEAIASQMHSLAGALIGHHPQPDHGRKESALTPVGSLMDEFTGNVTFLQSQVNRAREALNRLTEAVG